MHTKLFLVMYIDNGSCNETAEHQDLAVIYKVAEDFGYGGPLTHSLTQQQLTSSSYDTQHITFFIHIDGIMELIYNNIKQFSMGYSILKKLRIAIRKVKVQLSTLYV